MEELTGRLAVITGTAAHLAERSRPASAGLLHPESVPMMRSRLDQLGEALRIAAT